MRTLWTLVLATALCLPAMASRWLVMNPAKTSVITLCDGDFGQAPDLGEKKSRVVCEGARRNSWKMSDKLCFYPKDGALEPLRKIGCGTIAGQKGPLTLLKFGGEGASFTEGDRVRVAKETAGSSNPDVFPGTFEVIEAQHLDRFKAGGGARTAHGSGSHKNGPRLDISVGANAGLNYFFPAGHFQYSLTDSLAIGIIGSYVSASDADTKVSGIGLGVSLSLYPNRTNRLGMFARLAGGIYLFNVTNFGLPDSLSSPFGEAVIGGRLSLGPNGSGLQARLGVGGLYIKVPTDRVPIDFNGFLPLFIFEIGFAF